MDHVLKDVSSGSTNVTNSWAGFKINETPPFVMRRMDTPIVCALNGAAAGYGMDMALGCDFILASDRARFVPPVRRGVIPESGGTWLLPRLVGWHKACEITLLARVLEAPDIERLGLDSTFEANSNAVMADLMQLFRGEDFKESLIAFMEKRPAKYQLR